MQKQVLNFLNQIADVTTHILDLYDILIRMEKEGQKDTHAYDNMVTLLELTIDEEEALYTFLTLDTELTIDVSNYLFEQRRNKPIPSIYEAIIDLDRDEMVILRIHNRMNKIITRSGDYFLTWGNLNEGLLTAIEYEGESKALGYLYEMKPQLESTTNIGLANFINEAKKIFPELSFPSKAKHYLSFLEPQLEEIYIRNGFNRIPKDFNSRIMTTYEEDVSEEFKDYVKNTYGMKKADLAANKLEELATEKEIDHRQMLVYISLLRVSLLYLNESAQQVLYDRLTENHHNNDAYLTIIDQIFNTSEETFVNVNKDLNNGMNLN